MFDVKHDGTFDLATASSSNSLKWKNKEWLWSDFVNKLSTTHRTVESHSEYMQAKKLEQDKIKNVGGFVGGYLTGGKRSKNSVLYRQLITLDIDFSKGGFWDDFTMLYGCAAAMYSTHKHSPESPRLRLIIILDRPVRPDEYQAIGRRIAGDLDIEAFDITTFQAERMMYWPSTSKDGEYIFEFQEGPWLCADEVLATYRDWKDTSAWPVSEKVDKIIKNSMTKQGDPLEKEGVIGAFCRSYSIQEVIDAYLPDIYEKCDNSYDRYTYKEGSTAGGLVVYDDKFAFSHHGTDPASGKLCNAFDLVRIHKFGLKDEDSKEATPVNKLPSYLAMTDLCTSDVRVKKLIVSENLSAAKSDFEFIESTDEEIDDSWQEDLDVDRKGNILSSINNVCVVLKNDPNLKNKFQFDEFESELIVTGKLPWRNDYKEAKSFTDDDEALLAGYLESIKVPYSHIPKGLARIRNDYKVHPVRDYIKSTKWDGSIRVEKLLIEYLGAEDNEYTRAVTRKTLIAAVARVFKPGIKFDTMLVLVGKKGVGKSTIFKLLAGKWFSDTMGDIHDKSGMENLRGVWIMEVAELFGFKKADQDAIKRFLSSSEDIYRPAYAKRTVRYPRQCIMVGTTNKFDFVNETDERRFLPVNTLVTEPTKNMFTDLTESEVSQIWAEAYTYFKSGESIDLSKETKELAEKVREQHAGVDEREGIIEAYLNMLLPIDWNELSTFQRRSYISAVEKDQPGIAQRDTVCVAEIWCEALGGNQKEMNSYNTKFIHDYLRKSKDWAPTNTNKRFGYYGTQKGYKWVGKSVNADQISVNAEIISVHT